MTTHGAGTRVVRSPATDLGEVARLRREVESLRGRLSKLNVASLGIAGSLEIDVVLQSIIEASRLLTGARYGAILIFDSAGEVENLITSGISEEEGRIDGAPLGLGILGYLNEIDGPLRLSDIENHPKSIGIPENHPFMKSFLGIPMSRAGERFGNIYLAEKEGGGEFTPEDEVNLQMFAAQAAASIANSRIHDKESRARADLEALLDIAPVAVMVFDAKTRDLLSLNPEARRIVYGQKVPDRSQKGVMSVLTLRRPNGQDFPIEEFATERAIASGETIRAVEMVIHLPDGKAIPVLNSAVPIRSEDGEIVRVVATLQDMSPLEDLERMRADFLDIVVNELRNPVSSIKGAVATVLDSASSPDPMGTRQYLRIVEQQADRMNGLIGSLFDMSRIESGLLSLDTAPVDAAELIEEARRTVLARGARSVITLDITQPLPLVTADRRRVMQVLLNLISNASKHSPDSSEITVSALPDESNVVVSVTDEGAGIAPDHLPHIFRKYSQFDPGYLGGPEVEDSLGLAICRGIVEAHGGRIWAESDGLGLGAKFTFALPVAEERVLESTPEPYRTTAEAPHEEVRGLAQVLAVDRDTYMLRSIRSTLDEAGYTPITTSDPRKAVQLVQTEKPDLVLLDYSLPEADGLELIKRILDVADVPLIVTPEHDEDELMSRAFGAGAEDYLVKPFSPGELAARIKAVLRKREARVAINVQRPFSLGDLTIDYVDRVVTVGGRQLQLTPTEFKLLREFSTNAGRVLSHDHLLRRVWDSEYFDDTQVVRTFVKNLRRKLGDTGSSPKYILTEPRVGYRMPKP